MTFLKYTYCSCFILAALLFATPSQQLLKTPALFRHYHEHQQQQPGITFMDFIYMHYIGDDGVPDDENKDMQLPFKRSDRGPSLLVTFNAKQTLLFTRYSFVTNINYAPFTNSFLPEPHKWGLLRPPQV